MTRRCVEVSRLERQLPAWRFEATGQPGSIDASAAMRRARSADSDSTETQNASFSSDQPFKRSSHSQRR